MTLALSLWTGPVDAERPWWQPAKRAGRQSPPTTQSAAQQRGRSASTSTPRVSALSGPKLAARLAEREAWGIGPTRVAKSQPDREVGRLLSGGEAALALPELATWLSLGPKQRVMVYEAWPLTFVYVFDRGTLNKQITLGPKAVMREALAYVGNGTLAQLRQVPVKGGLQQLETASSNVVLDHRHPDTLTLVWSARVPTRKAPTKRIRAAQPPKGTQLAKQRAKQRNRWPGSTSNTRWWLTEAEIKNPPKAQIAAVAKPVSATREERLSLRRNPWSSDDSSAEPRASGPLESLSEERIAASTDPLDGLEASKTQ